MDRRWAPVAAAGAVALVVGAAVLLGGGEDSGREDGVVTLPPAAVAPTEEPTEEPTTLPTPPEPSHDAPTRRPAPDDPVSSEPEPEPQPARTSPPPSPRPSAAAAPPSAAPSPVAGRAAFAFDAAYGTDEPHEVVVQYGDSSSCPHERVEHAVRETADRVVVTLRADAHDPGRGCTADYRQVLVPVRLQAPLGDRALVDGSRGEQVPVDRSCSRPFAEPPPPRDCEP